MREVALCVHASACGACASRAYQSDVDPAPAPPPWVTHAHTPDGSSCLIVRARRLLCGIVRSKPPPSANRRIPNLSRPLAPRALSHPPVCTLVRDQCEPRAVWEHQAQKLHDAPPPSDLYARKPPAGCDGCCCCCCWYGTASSAGRALRCGRVRVQHATHCIASPTRSPAAAATCCCCSAAWGRSGAGCVCAAAVGRSATADGARSVAENGCLTGVGVGAAAAAPAAPPACMVPLPPTCAVGAAVLGNCV